MHGRRPAKERRERTGESRPAVARDGSQEVGRPQHELCNGAGIPVLDLLGVDQTRVGAPETCRVLLAEGAR